MSEISAARHNNLQSRIEAILGTGSGTKGYGQTVSSYQVGGVELDIIRAQDLNFVYADMVKARIHQIGPSSLEIAQVIKDLNVIATETSYQTANGVDQISDPDGNKKGIADFERLMAKIEADKFLVDSSQADIENAIISSRNQAWNEEIYHEFVVEFDDTDHRRYFFNSGGYISLSADIANTTTDKGLDWKEILESVGNIIFDYQSTKNESDGSGTLIGNYELTSEYQVVYNKIGGGIYSSVYGGNNYRISAKEISNGTAIQFKIEFRDIIQDNTVDNVIDGTITSRVQQRRANSANVSVKSPSYFNVLEL